MMSKYYKADEVEKLLSCGCAYAIRDLPTIEVSEDLVKDKRCKGCSHYRLTCDLFSEICKYEPKTQIETQNSNLTFEIADTPKAEVSEDCISREWVKGICEAMLDEEMLGHMLGHIDDAPSVVVRNNRTTTEQSSMVGEWKWESDDICDNCGYEIPHLERVIGETVLMSSKDWKYCPNCGEKIHLK